jgi:ribosomal-protein-alanine N-acetyltransferase
MAARHLPLLTPGTRGLLRRLGFSRREAQGMRFGRVVLLSAQPGDWTEWAALRGASRAFLTPWESSWPEDALTWAAFRRRLRQYAEDRDRGTGYYFLIRRAGDDALLGGINLTNVRRGITQSGTLGYWIGAPFARQGYMTEAMRAILSFAFDELRLNRVEAACLPDNAASRALLARCGFEQEGRARKYLRINGMWQDHLTFAILREDWAAREAKQTAQAKPARE